MPFRADEDDQLPDDWVIRTLGEVATVVGGGTPSRETKSFWNGDIPWVTPGEVSKEQSKYIARTAEQITTLGLGSSGANLLPAGALLVTTRATLGARVIAAVPMATNQGFKSLVFPAGDDADFYYYMASKLKPELVRRASGTTFLEISSREFSRIEVPCPSHGERQWIARVLDTLDTAIRQTEAIIAKLKQVKQGLLHDLLTRGIDANGELRPPQPQAPHLYKQSPLGWIPREWEVQRLGNLVVEHQAGIYKNRALYGAGSNIVGVADLFAHRSIDGQTFRNVLASPVERSQFRLLAGDLVYAESSLVLDGIAKTLAVTAQGEGTLFAWHTRRLRVDRERANPMFLAHSLSSPACRRFVMSRATQTALTGIPVTEYLATPVPLPSLSEQSQIVTKLEAIDVRIAKERRLETKMNLDKSGLMDDLLTGRVRVTPLLEAVATP